MQEPSREVQDLNLRTYKYQRDLLRYTGDIEGSREPCSNCQRAEIPCIKATKQLRFRNVTKPKKATGFAANQPWLQASSTLSFRDETLALEAPSKAPITTGETEQVHQSTQEQTNLSPSLNPIVIVDQTSSTLLPTVPSAHEYTVHHHRPREETYVPPEPVAHAIVDLSPTTIIAATPPPAATRGSSMKVVH